MAAAAGADDLRMVDERCGDPAARHMTALARLGCPDMGGRAAGGIDAVVTAYAVVGDAGVVESCRGPCFGGMTVVAFARRPDVSRMFAEGGDTVVAARTGADDMVVVDDRDGNPLGGIVADLTVIGAFDVCG